MAIGFEYTLGVNETESLTALNKFIEKVQEMDVKIAIDFDLSSQDEAISKLKSQLSELAKGLTIPVKVDLPTGEGSGGLGTTRKTNKDISKQIDLGNIKGPEFLLKCCLIPKYFEKQLR